MKFFSKTKAYKEFQEMIMEYKKAKEFEEVIMGYKKAFVPNLEVLQTASSVKRLSIANLVRWLCLPVAKIHRRLNKVYDLQEKHLLIKIQFSKLIPNEEIL